MDWLRELAVSGVEAGWLSDSFSYAFMVNAIVAALILGPLLGGLGTLVIAKRLAFFSEAVGHAALTGIAIGVLLGEPPENPIIGLFSFCMIFALLLHFVRNRTNVPYDTLVGVFLALALAVGAALLMYVARKINIHMLENVLFGSILTVTDNDILILAISCLIILLLLIPTITLVTIAAVKIIGAVLVGALLLIPGATARLLTKRMGSFVLLSSLLATIAVVNFCCEGL